MSTITATILIFIISIFLYGANKIEMGVVGLLTIAALVLTKALEPSEALTYFSNGNVILMMSMFVISTGLSKTSIIENFSKKVMQLTGNNFKKTYLSYLVLSAILTNFINSPLAAFSIVFPLVRQMCDDYNVSPSKVMFPVGLVVIATCAILPFGAAIQLTGMYNGYLESYGFTDIVFSPTDFTIGRLPFLILVPIWSYTLGYKISPEEPVTEISLVTVKREAKVQLNKVADWAGVLIFFGVIIFFIFGSKIGVQPWIVTYIGALLMVLFGTLNTKEAINALPINLACMLIGSLAMAGALTSTGAAEVIGDYLASVLGGVTNGYILGAVFFIVPFALTQFMQNQAVMNIFVPIALLVSRSLGANPIGLMVMITAGCLTAFMTPMATSSIPAVMGAGGYNINSLVKQGIPISILLAIVYILYVPTVLPIF